MKTESKSKFENNSLNDFFSDWFEWFLNKNEDLDVAKEILVTVLLNCQNSLAETTLQLIYAAKMFLLFLKSDDISWHLTLSVEFKNITIC